MEWAEPTDLPGSTAWAWYPIQLELCPRSFDILDCTFERIGQSTSGAAIALGLCVSDVEIRDNTFVMCVDGVMSDASGSGLNIHDTDFILCMEGLDEGGDGNAIDLKGVRPRTWPGGVEPATVDDIPESAWTLIYNNNFIGCSGVTIVLQKGTSFVRVWNNRLFDNYQGIMVTTGTMSVLPAPYESEWFDGGSATIFSGDLHGRILSGDVDPDFYYSALVDAPETDPNVESLFCAKYIYIYRNVIACTKHSGIILEEGVTISSGEQPVAGLRNPRGLSLQNIVVAHNTVDSNGAEFANGNGISLTRNTGKFDGDGFSVWGLDETDTSAATLGDHFLSVAVYNNIFSNNAYYQTYVVDDTLSQEEVDVDMPSTETKNIELNDEGTNITSFLYWAFDYNAYYYPEATPRSSGRFKVPGAEEYIVAWGETFALGVEMNSLYVSDYAGLFSTDHPDLDPTSRRSFFTDHRGPTVTENLAFYDDILAFYNDLWRTEAEVGDQGAVSDGTLVDFPIPVGLSTLTDTDILDHTIVGRPDIGAYEIVEEP